MGRRGRHPDPKSKRSQAALARAKQLAKYGQPPAVQSHSINKPTAPNGNLEAPATVAARPAAAAFWNRHVQTLVADGRLRDDLVETFGILCHHYADAQQLAEQVAAEGWITASEKGQQASPIARLLRDSRRDYVTLAREFGLTAASAARLPQDGNSGEEEDDDPEAALLAKLSIRNH